MSSGRRRGAIEDDDPDKQTRQWRFVRRLLARRCGGAPDEELAFYDVLETNDGVVQVLGEQTLREVAHELVETVRNDVKIDWRLRENVRANLRRLVKRVLRKHGYSPDKQEQATRTLLEQAEVLSADWATSDLSGWPSSP